MSDLLASAQQPTWSNDLTASKLLPPLVRAGTVRRWSLLERLVDTGPCRIVSMVAPAGYGKSTLLSQWAERGDQTFAWVSIDEADNDPKVLLTYVAGALNAVEPLDTRVFDALTSSASSVPGTVVPRLASAFASMSRRVVLVLDDVHLLRDRTCRDALSVLAENVPDGSRLVLAGRTSPPLRIARLRTQGRILEVGVADLSLTPEEADALLREAGATLTAEEVAALYNRTEGWPVGLYLAALCLREGSSLDRAVASFGGDDQLVSQYIESEFLVRIDPRQRAFLMRSAVLERMSGPLCEAALGVDGAAASLADLARSNMLLVPLDRRGQWYRYHHLFREMLRADLIDHWQYGRPGWPTDDATEAYAATLRAVHCRRGPEQMRVDLDEAVLKYSFAGIVSPTPALYRGIACIMSGDPGSSDAHLQESVAVAEQTHAQEVLVAALYRRSMRLLPHRCRASGAAHAGNASVHGRHRRRAVRLGEHRQVTRQVDLPQARGGITHPGGQPLPPARSPGGMRPRTGVRFPFGCPKALGAGPPCGQTRC